MKQGVRRLSSLLLVFVVAFAVVFLIRNGTDGIRNLFGGGKAPNGYRPESFTLPEHAPLELDEVELLSRLNEEYAKLTDAVVPSVVSIDTEGEQVQRLLDGRGRQLIRPVRTQGRGSGVIVTHEGHIVTNEHVVKDQQQIQVTLHDGRSYKAKLIAGDPMTDIAVLKIDGKGPFKPLKFGDSSEVRRGQIVFAIGNPFGLGETVTQGIISALERSLSDTKRDLFQTDAAINPGNSGGPLVNLRGEIIGINSAIYRPEGMNAGFQGVGFSIPSNDVKEVMYAILERGRPIRGYLGVRMDNLSPRVAAMLNYEGDNPVIISVLPGSPAEKAGLRSGDIVLKFDGEDVTRRIQIFNRVKNAKVGEVIKATVWREGETLDLEATIAEVREDLMPAARSAIGGRPKDPAKVLAAVGLTVKDAAAGQSGVVVTNIAPKSLAAGRMLVGDRILSINRSPVTTTAEFDAQMAASAATQTTLLDVIRGQRRGTVQIPALPRDGSGLEESAPMER